MAVNVLNIETAATQHLSFSIENRSKYFLPGVEHSPQSRAKPRSVTLT